MQSIRWNNARGWVTACLVKRRVVPQVYHLSSLELGAVGKNKEKRSETAKNK